jgi:Icc protein
MTVVRLTQITDLHLGPDSDAMLGGVRTLESFQSVLQAVDQNGRGTDLLLLTGDLAGDCEPQAYQLLNRTLGEYNKQAIWLPGNHDDVDVMAANLVDYPQVQIHEMSDWAILTLDSSQPHKPGGHIADKQLALVEQSLDRLGDKFVLLAMHHSPVDVGCAWLDLQQIDNQHQLHQLVLAHGNVKAVITGHVHQQFDGSWGELPIYSAPSSCVQFKPHSHDFALSGQPPGYRWLDLHPEGTVKTGVEFLQDFAQIPDLNCANY